MTLAKAVSMKYNKTIEKCSNEEIYFALLDMTKQMAEDKVSNDLIKFLQEEINLYPWIWDLEQCNIYKAYMITDKGKMDREAGYFYFMKQKDSNTWFSASKTNWYDSLLDTDGYFYNQILSE